MIRDFLLNDLAPWLRKYGPWIMVVLFVIGAYFILASKNRTGEAPLIEPTNQPGFRLTKDGG